MSSRLFIARIIPMLLLLLGVFGTAVADTGGGSPKKNSAAFVAPTVNNLVVSNGGNATPGLICSSNTITITPTITGATNIVSYSITPSFGFSVAQTSSAPGFATTYLVPPAPGGGFLVITAVATNGLGESSAPFSLTFNVFESPTGGLVAIPPTICIGNPVTLSLAQPGNLTVLTTGSSSFTGGPSGLNSVAITPQTSGANSFSILGSDGNGCFFNNTVSVTVTAAPTGTVIASPNPVCANSPISFSVSGTNAVSAVIAGANPNPTTSILSPFVSSTTPSPFAPDGTFTVSYTLTGSTGCTAVATASYTVIALPANGPAVSLLAGTTLLGEGDARAVSANVTAVAGAPVANATSPSPSYTVCQNSSLILSLSACAIVSPIASDPTATTTTVAPGYYIVTTSAGAVTVANGITSYPLPTTATGTNGYQVTCFNSLGCSSTAVASFTLTVLPTPVAPTLASTQGGAGPSYSICAGQSFSLTVGCLTGSASALTGTTNIPLGAGGLFNTGNGTVAGSYTYAATCQTASCTSVATNFTLVVNPLPAQGPHVSAMYSAPAATTTVVDATAASAAGSITVCQNSTLMLSVTGCTTSNPSLTTTNPIIVIVPGGSVGGGASVLASGGPGTGTYLVSTSAISTSLTGPYLYTIVCVNSFGCSSTAVASLSVTVKPTPAAPTFAGGIVPGQSLTICHAQPLSGSIACPTGSNVNSTPTTGAFTAAGTPASFTITGVNNTAVPIVQSFTVTCVGTPGGCPSPPVTYTLTVNPAPTGPHVTVTGSPGSTGTAVINATAASAAGSVTVCQNSSLMLSVTGCTTANPSATATNPITVIVPGGSVGGGASVIAVGGPGTGLYAISTANLSTTATGPYVYTIVCTNSFGCSSTSVASLSVTVNPSPGLASITAVNGTPANVEVAGAGMGAVAICQGPTPLVVNSNCLVAAGGTSSSGGSVTASSVLGAGVGVSSTATSGTFVSFSVSAATVGTFSYSFVCVNSSGCPSLTATVLTVTVNGSATTPATIASRTVCESSGNVLFATGCGTDSATIVSGESQSPLPSSAVLASNTLTIGSATRGTFVYGIQCKTTAGCSSSTVSYTLVVNPRPVNANLSLLNGVTSDTNVAGGQLGSVSLCQGASLSVNTNCLVATGSTTGTVNPITGVNSGSTGTTNVPDGTTAAQGGGVGSGTSSSTFAAYTIATTTPGLSTYTFVCVNQFGCTSPLTTTLTVQVNASVVAPTTPMNSTVCLNQVASVTANCATGSTAVYSGAQSLTGNVQSLATSVAGVFPYTVVCQNSTCISMPLAFTLVVNPRPNNASLTALSGTTVLATVPATGPGSISVCQNTVLKVVTDCLLSTSTSAGVSNSATGVNNGGIAGVDGTTAATGGSISSDASSSTFAAFNLTSGVTGTTTFTFNCVNQFGCASPQATTLSVTVSGSVAAPTGLASLTTCLNTAASVTAVCATMGSTAVYSGAQSLTGGVQSLAVSATGVFAYTVVCQTAFCVSAPTMFTLTVNPRPADAGLTVNTSPTTTLTTVAAAGMGSVAVCQNQSLTVITSCVINSAPVAGTGNVATGVNSGSVNQDGSVVAISNGVTNGTTSTTYAAFVVSTSAIGTTTFTFQCQNSFSCTSANSTTLALVVSGSVAAPTGLASLTTCLNIPASVTAVCSTASSTAVYSGAQSLTGGVQSLAVSATGVFAYTVVCQTAFCTSVPTMFTLTVNPVPNNASLTAVNGTPANLAVVGGMSGSVSVCQGAPLRVNTDCLIATGGLTSGAVSITGVNSTSVGSSNVPDGSTASQGGGVISTGSTSSTFASYLISTQTTGTGTFTFVCRNSSLCSSPTVTTLTVTILDAPTSPTANFAGTGITSATLTPTSTTAAVTICQNTPISLTVVGCNAASQGTVTSQATQTNGGAVLTGNQTTSGSTSISTFPLANTAVGTFSYSIACTNAAGCSSQTMLVLNVTVNATPASATLSGAVTGGQNLTLCAGSLFEWVNTCPTGSVPVRTSLTGNNATLFTVTGTSVTAITGAAGSQTVSLGSSTSTITGATLTTLTTITLVSASSTTSVVATAQVAISGSTTVLVGSAIPIPTNGTGYYTTRSSITSSGRINSLTSVAINFGTTASVNAYTVTCQTGVCQSPVTAFTLTVNPQPANAGLTVNPATLGGVAGTSLVSAGGGASMTICQGNPISVTVTGCATTTTAGSTSVVSGGSSGGANFGGVQITPGTTGVNAFTVLTATTGTFVYTATCSNSFGCTSPLVTSLTVTVNPTPDAPVITAGVTASAITRVCTNQTLNAVATCPTGSNLSISSGSVPTGSMGSFTAVIATATSGTTSYSLTCVATQGGCPSPVTPFTVVVNVRPNDASLTAVGGTPANQVVSAGGVNSVTICQFSSLTANTNCFIAAGAAASGGLSVTGVTSGNSGSTGVPEGSTASLGGVVITGAASTSTYASYLLPTATAGTYAFTVVCLNAAGCTSPNVTTLNVTVNPTPAAPAPVVASGLLPNLVLCETTVANSPLSVTACPVGTTATVTSTLGGRLITTAGSQTFAITTSGVPASGVTGSFTIVCVNSSGCPSAPYVASLTLNAAPARPTGATIAAGNPAFATTTSLTICQGQPVSLTVDGCQIASGSGGGTALTGSGTGFIFTGTGFTFTPTGPTTATALVTDGNLQQGLYTFIVRCTNANGCQSLQGSSFSLVVTGQPSAVAVAGFAPTCPPTSVTGTLGCSVGSLQAGYRLVGTTGAFTPTGANVMLPTTAGIYTLTAVCTTGGACLGTPVSLTLYNRLRTPAPVSVQTVQNAVCLGQSTTLVAVCATTASTAIWYLANTNTVVSGTALGATSIIVAPLQQGTYNYEAVCTDPAYGCASVRSTEIVLNVLPGVNSLPTISAQPNPTVAGAPVTLTGAGCAGTTIFYIQGTNTEVGRGNGGLVSLTVTPQVTTTYDAVCTNGQCTSNRTTGLVVFVTPCTFAATVTPSSAVICATGGSVQLTASGGTGYVWNNGQNTQQITVSAAGVYNVVVTSAQGCTAMASATITTGTAPSPTITGNTNIFAGASTTLTAGGGGLYAWNGPGLAPNAGGASQVVSQAGMYVVTVTSPSGCTASASVTVTTIALPPAPTVTPTAAVQPNATLQACVGQTVQLVASCPVGSMPRFKIGSTTNDALTQNVTSSSPGTVLYNVVCVAGGVEGPSTFAQVVFNGVPTVQILQTGVLCSNRPSSATLSATGASSYTWSTGATTQSIVVNANAAGLYSVNGANAAGCVATASQQVSSAPCDGPVSVMMITGATIDCVNGNVTIAATGGNGNQIQYSIGGVQYSASNPVALDPAFQNNPANMFIQLYVRQVNSANTGFDVAGPFQFNFRAVCPVVTPPAPITVAPPSLSICGAPTNTIGQALVVTGVTDVNCLVGSFRVVVQGGDGSPLNFAMIVGLNNADPTNCTRRVDNGEQLMAINNPNSTIQPFQVRVLQNGAFSNTFMFDFKLFCTGQTTTPPAPVTTTPPVTPPVTSANPAGCGSPANTVGQALVVSGVDQVNCATGTFRILTTGGNGATISYADIVGLSNNDPYNCTRRIDNAEQLSAINNPNSSIGPFSLRVRNIGGAVSPTFSFNMKQVCTGVARTARTEGAGTLDVTVLGNPTLGETVEVEVRGAEGQALQLRLVDGMGAAISEKSVEKAGSTERQTISLGRSAGMYFLQVTTPDKSKTVKVVRQ